LLLGVLENKTVLEPSTIGSSFSCNGFSTSMK